MGHLQPTPATPRAPRLVHRWLLQRLAPILAIHVAAMVGLAARERAQDRELGQITAAGVLALQEELLDREFEFAASTATFLAQQSSVTRFLAGLGEREQVIEDFAALCRESRSFDQIRILDEGGGELVRVNFQAGEPVSVDPAELQNKSDRYYFRAAQDLAASEVFVSAFDLNVEHGQIELPWKPVIRFSAPVILSAGRSTLVVNYLGANLLERLALSAQPLDGWSALVDGAGYYLEAPTRQLSWGSLFELPPTFASGHPTPWEAMQSGAPTATFTPEGLYVARPFVARGAPTQVLGEQGLHLVAFTPRARLYADSNRATGTIWGLGGLAALIALASTVVLARAAERRDADEIRVLNSEGRLRDLSTRLLNAQEAERLRISRDLHDELGQIATAVKIELKLADQQPDKRATFMGRAAAGVDHLLDTVHDISSRLRSSVLDDLGLADALTEHCAEIQKRTGLNINVDVAFESELIPGNVAIHAYRIVQEALNNVVRHASARTASVGVSMDPSEIAIEIRDDGDGFDPETIDTARLGLLGMRERVELLEGRFEIDSARSAGSTVRAWLPIHSEEAP